MPASNIECDYFQGEAYSDLPDGYTGPCIVELTGRHCRTIGLPDVSNAHEAAVFAVGYLGGYHVAKVLPGTADQITHAEWHAWAFE